MRKEITQEIEIPQGTQVKITENEISVKGKEGENKRKLEKKGFSLKQEGNKVIVFCEKGTKKEKKLINSLAAHIRNMVKGVNEKYTYELKVCFNHFPVTLEQKGTNVLVKNFLGEKVPRIIAIPRGAEVKLNKDKITITSTDIEDGGRAAAMFESVTRIRNRDRRIFQDGIFITKKPGEED